MGTKTVTVSLRVNDAGFMSQECPACERRFKVQPGKGSSRPIAFCPYCSHEGTGCWWTKAQAEYLGRSGADAVITPELERMTRDFNRRAGGGFIKMSASVQKPPAPRQPIEDNDDWPTVVFACCGETIRHDDADSKLRCIICGSPDSAHSASTTGT